MEFVFVLAYYIIINAAAFALYGADKSRARRHAWRISEKTLLGVSLFGGFIGAYGGMCFFRHKTRHGYFSVVILLSLIIHAAFWFWRLTA